MHAQKLDLQVGLRYRREMSAGGPIVGLTGGIGSGKSTVVQLSPQLPTLSDDLVVLLVRDGRVVTERVPFYGLYPSTART